MTFIINMLVVFFLLLGICVNYTRHLPLTLQEFKKYQNLIEGQGLYKADEDVYILTASNYKKQLYGKPYGNLVEFYNSWCGFCQRFQPTWSALATDIKNWKDVLIISALDCSDEENAPICRDFEILAYPTLRYFHENYSQGPQQLGVEVTKGEDMQGHKAALLKHVISEQTQERAKMVPNIAPYTHNDLTHIFDNIQVQYVFFIVQPRESEMLGAEIALDLNKIPNVAVKYPLSNNTDLLAKVQQGVTAFSHDAPLQPITINVTTPYNRQNVLLAIKTFLQQHSIYIPSPTSAANIFTGKWNDVQLPSNDDLQQARAKASLRHKIKKMGDVVFQADLETALRYSLKHEVARSKILSDDKLLALQNYLKVIVKYFPFGPKGHEFFRNLSENVVSSTNIEGATLARWISEAEQPSTEIFSSPPQWMACEGSFPSFRRYPCGLWKLFHYLTVNAAEFNNDNDQAYPREILDAMLGYVKHFFGCSDCSKHFQDMAEEKDMKSVSSLDSAILWLWMAHNAVNKRLSLDATEDPEYPKIQYPSQDNCPTCRELDKKWNLPEVLRYLKVVYSNLNVRYIGSDTKILHVGLEGSNIYNNSSSTSSIFERIDMSMFFILYLISFVLLVILIRLFLKRRRYIKKIYVHDLLGKV